MAVLGFNCSIYSDDGQQNRSRELKLCKAGFLLCILLCLHMSNYVQLKLQQIFLLTHQTNLLVSVKFYWIIVKMQQNYKNI